MGARTFYWMIGAAALASALPEAAESQVAAPVLTYADIADLALSSPVAAHVRVGKAVPVKAAQAVGLRPGYTRLYVQAELVALVKASEPLPNRLSYVVDLPQVGKGKAPKLSKGTELILLAHPVPGRPGELRLAAPDAQLAYTSERAAQLRSIVAEARAATPPPRVTGISRAFHVPGTVAGESETQIFLSTAERTPASLSVLRRPGAAPQWAVSLSEIVDEAATPPAPHTLLWYRLACGLPRALPAQSLSDAGANAREIQADYRLILDRLGPCARSRARP
ncbi:MAG TPA: hypothetical protein VGB59_01170 [Allosphingosinicella sp.]|jgi:hypothetical protein